MFCIKCGNPINENDKFCEACGAKIELATSVVEETANTPPVDEIAQNTIVSNENNVNQPNVSENIGDVQAADTPVVPVQPDAIVVESVKKPKKRMSKKKKAIIAGVVGTIAAAVAAVCIFAWDYVENFFVETFSSSESYYQYVEGKNINELASSVGSVVGLLNNDNSNFGNNSTVKLQLGDAVLDFIAQQSGMNKADIQWLSNIGVNTDVSVVKDTVSMGLDCLIGDKTAMGVDFIFDYENQCAYICIPQFNEKYVIIDMSETVEDLNSSDYEEAMAMLNSISSAMPDEATTTKIIARYLNAAIEAIDDVDKDSVTIKANGVSQKCTRLSYTIDEDTIKDILEAVLREFQNDDEIENIIKDVVVATGEIDEDDFEDMYDELVDNMDMVIDRIDDIRMGDFEVEIITYVDGRGEVIGREIEVEDADIEFHYYTTHNGDDVGVEMVLAVEGERIELLGNGTLDGDLLDCDYTLSVGGVKMLNVKAVDYDVMKAEEGYANGKFIITLPEETCSLIERNLGVSSEICELLPNISIEVVIKQSKSSGYLEISLLDKSDLIIKLSLSSNDSKPSNIVTPSDAIKLENENDLENYASNLDLENFMQHLKDLGIPESFFEAISDAINQENDLGYNDNYGYNYDYDYDYDFGYSDNFSNEYAEPNYDFNYGAYESYEDVYGGFIY